jgi:hypothetical protein
MGFYVANEHQTVADEPCPKARLPTAPRSERMAQRAFVTDHPLKKSRLGFFSSSRSRAGFFASQPLETHLENGTTPTKTVSGISCWLARDPIGAKGGLNQTGFVKNNPIILLDRNGLEIVIFPPIPPPFRMEQTLYRSEVITNSTDWSLKSAYTEPGSCDSALNNPFLLALCLGKPIKCLCGRKKWTKTHTWTEIRELWYYQGVEIPDIYPILVESKNHEYSDPTPPREEEQRINSGACMMPFDPPSKKLTVCHPICKELN